MISRVQLQALRDGKPIVLSLSGAQYKTLTEALRPHRQFMRPLRKPRVMAD